MNVRLITLFIVLVLTGFQAATGYLPTSQAENPYLSKWTVYKQVPNWSLPDATQSAPVNAPIRISQTPLSAQVSTFGQSSPEAIVQRLEAANEVPATLRPTVQIIPSKTLNAATDGQKIMVTDSLYSKLQTDDERAFVLSHEFSHILLSHIAKTQIRRTGISLFDVFMNSRYGQNSAIALASKLGLNLWDLRSSRVYEYQADDLGVRLMTKAGYNPQAAISVFKILQANTPNSGEPGFLMDHPITEDRIRMLAQKYKLSLQ